MQVPDLPQLYSVATLGKGVHMKKLHAKSGPYSFPVLIYNRHNENIRILLIYFEIWLEIRIRNINLIM